MSRLVYRKTVRVGPSTIKVSYSTCSECGGVFNKDDELTHVGPRRWLCAACIPKLHMLECAPLTELEKEAELLIKKCKITAEKRTEMLVAQNGRCACCKLAFLSTRETHIDHDHRTGKIRGLIHRGCNSMLGFAGDSVARLQCGIDYLIIYEHP
jgi:hypothetical protein